MDQRIDIEFQARTTGVEASVEDVAGSITTVRDAMESLNKFVREFADNFAKGWNERAAEQAAEDLRKAAREANELGDQVRRAGGEMDDLSRKSGGLSITMGDVRRMAAGIFAGMGVIEIGRQIIDTSSEFERLRGVLETLEPAQGVAAARFEDLRKLAATTPFQLQEVVTAFSRLKAMGLDPSSAAIVSYGNTASAMGKSLDQMIEAVADAATGEFERLKEFGIKSRQEGDSVTFTFQGVSTTVGKSSQEIQDYLLKIGNTNFAGAMEKQSATFGGLMSNLQDNIANVANQIGQGGLMDALKAIVTEMNNAGTASGDWAGVLGGVLGTVVTEVWGIIRSFGEGFAAVLRTVADIMRQVTGSTQSDGEIWKSTILEIQRTIIVFGTLVQQAFTIIGGVVSFTAQTVVSAGMAIYRALNFDFSGAVREVERWGSQTIDIATRTWGDLERITKDGQNRFNNARLGGQEKAGTGGVALPGYEPPPAQASTGKGAGGGGGGGNRVQVWAEELQRMRALSEDLLRDTTSQDLEFWRGKLDKTTQGSKDWYAVQEKIYAASRTLAQQHYQEETSRLDFEIQSARGQYAEQARLEQEKVDLVLRTYGEQSSQYRAAIREQERMAQQHEDELRRIRMQGIQQRMQLDAQSVQTDLQIQREAFTQISDALAAQVQAGLVGRREAAAQRAEIALAQFEAERQSEERIHEIRMSALREQLAMEGLMPSEVMRIQEQIENANRAHVDRMRLMDAQYTTLVRSNSLAAAEATRQVWMDRLAPVTQALTGMVNGFLAGTMSVRQAMLNLGSQILQQLNSWVLQWVQRHVAGEQAATAASVAGNTARTAASTAAAAAQTAATTTAATAEITTNAAVAGSGALASVSKIPVIGPFIAPAIAAGIMALAMGFISKIASAEGGWDQVPYDGAMTELHKDEMVLPASIASPLREALASGGNWGTGPTGLASQSVAATQALGGGSSGEYTPPVVEETHVHVTAMDTRSGVRFLMENRHALARALKQAKRENAS